MPDLTITAANVLYTSGSKETGVAGVTITPGQTVYLDSSVSTIKLAQCDGTAAEANVIGVSLHGALAGQPITYLRTGGLCNIGATTVKTTHYVLSATPGGIAPQADLVATNKIVYVGYATDTSGSFVLQVKNTGAVV
jgi:hypothetical protein